MTLINRRLSSACLRLVNVRNRGCQDSVLNRILCAVSNSVELYFVIEYKFYLWLLPFWLLRSHFPRRHSWPGNGEWHQHLHPLSLHCLHISFLFSYFHHFFKLFELFSFLYSNLFPFSFHGLFLPAVWVWVSLLLDNYILILFIIIISLIGICLAEAWSFVVGSFGYLCLLEFPSVVYCYDVTVYCYGCNDIYHLSPTHLGNQATCLLNRREGIFFYFPFLFSW